MCLITLMSPQAGSNISSVSARNKEIFIRCQSSLPKLRAYVKRTFCLSVMRTFARPVDVPCPELPPLPLGMRGPLGP